MEVSLAPFFLLAKKVSVSEAPLLSCPTSRHVAKTRRLRWRVLILDTTSKSILLLVMRTVHVLVLLICFHQCITVAQGFPRLELNVLWCRGSCPGVALNVGIRVIASLIVWPRQLPERVGMINTCTALGLTLVSSTIIVGRSEASQENFPIDIRVSMVTGPSA